MERWGRNRRHILWRKREQLTACERKENVAQKDVEESIQPTAFFLEENHPNPASLWTEISFGVPESGPVTLSLYSALGTEIMVFEEATMFEAGSYTRRLEVSSLSSGAYFVRMTAGEFVETVSLLVAH